MIGFSPNATSVPYRDHGEVIGSWILPSRLALEKMFRLFCFPFAGGGVLSFGSWSHLLPAEIELCAIQLPGRESRLNETPFVHLENSRYSSRHTLDAPFAFFGQSIGAFMGFELVRLLRRKRKSSPIHLFVACRCAPHLSENRAAARPASNTGVGRTAREPKRQAHFMRDPLTELFSISLPPVFVHAHFRGRMVASVQHFQCENNVTTPADPLSLMSKFEETQAPEHSMSLESYIEYLENQIIPYSVNMSSPRCVGHMSSTLPNFVPALGDLITLLNQNLVKREAGS